MDENEKALARIKLNENSTRDMNGCLLWKGGTRGKGYGGISVDDDGKRKRESAHRLAYKLYKGDIQSGLFVCHTCDVRNCVEPSHLFVGTHSDNMRDMASKGRADCTEETRYKLSEARKGSKNHMYGRKHLAETRRGISESAKGNTRCKGRVLSGETKAKIRESLLKYHANKLLEAIKCG